MTTAVLAGFFLMLFAPCVFAIFGGRDKKTKAIAASYEDRAVNQIPERAAQRVVEDEELDIPRRREEVLVQVAAPAPVVPVAAPVRAARRGVDLQEVVERAESEALAAHAKAAEANAAALAATARAAQARAQAAAEQAAAEQAAEARRVAADHAAAVRVAQQYAAASEAALAEPAAKDGSRRAA